MDARGTDNIYAAVMSGKTDALEVILIIKP
jgi:hypothetical protein